MLKMRWLTAATAAAMVGVSAIGSRAVLAQGPQAQTSPPQTPAPTDIEADPIRCWWRTSASAVRVAEPFSLVLTCAIVENDTTTVVPDQARLDPAAMQLPPFEIIGGQRGPDLHSDQRRFFQYQYRLRLINEELFGKDAKIPTLQITYHLESHVTRGESVRGRDRIYLLPTESVRVLSLVPVDATDIRDTPSWTFDDIEAQRFRARVFYVVGSVLFAAAALVVIVALARLVRQYREEAAVGRRVLSDGAILRGVGRELASVQRASEREGWSHELVGRALAAFRIAGSIALGQHVGQSVNAAGRTNHAGQLLMRGGLLRGKKIWVSGSTTTSAIARELAATDASTSGGHHQCLEKLQPALARFTAAQFGRDDKLDETSLRESMAEGSAIVRRLKLENLWIVKKLKGASGFAAELGNRAWSR